MYYLEELIWSELEDVVFVRYRVVLEISKEVLELKYKGSHYSASGIC